MLERFVRSPLRPLRDTKQETFWALKDVSLAVKEGEVLGLIGERRGQDDSAEDMSRITRPTEGWAKIRGKVRQ